MDFITIFNKKLEYDFLSGWIKYNRLSNGISQEALAHGICSTSHLCYFEKGEKKLRSEIIEALLIKLGITKIEGLDKIGQVRQKLSKMCFEIETLNDDSAEEIWQSLSELEPLINHSPYSIEYRVYEIFYLTFLHIRDNFEYLKESISNIDKIFDALNDDIKYIFLAASGRFYFRFSNPSEGIKRLTKASKLKNTSFINYHLGFSYCFNSEPLRATYHLESALNNYVMNGQYLNAVWCHNYLGICYSSLNIFSNAETHFMAALNGANNFDVKDIFYHIYTNMGNLCMLQNKFNDAIKWSQQAIIIKDCDPILPASNYIQSAYALGELQCCKDIFHEFLKEEYKTSKYYNLLYHDYLYIFHFNEDLFYKETVGTIIPFYESINYLEILKSIKLRLIEYLEGKRKYKEANKLYKELLTI